MEKQEAVEIAARRIIIIRGQRVMLDSDLALIYGVSTKRLNEQMKRNMLRFPSDFVFQLTDQESENLRSQNATSSSAYGGRRHRPYAFTEHGAIMLATVLNSPSAVQASVAVVRAFVRFREMLAVQGELAKKVRELEQKIVGHDENIQSIFDAIRRLMPPLQEPKPQIGFHP